MNVKIKAGDAASTSVDFDVSLSSYTVASQIVSLVGGAPIASISTSVTNASEGQVSLNFPKNIPAGTYGWSMTWTSGNGDRRTVLTGIAEYVG